jgi:signal transduction histidine kinase
LVADFAGRTGITTALDEPERLPPLSPEAELALFRSLQEALSNIMRHAHASSVEVAITNTERSVVLRVRDNGRGMTQGTTIDRNGHMGLAGMRERITALGGSVAIGTGEEGGVMLEVAVPAPRRGP